MSRAHWIVGWTAVAAGGFTLLASAISSDTIGQAGTLVFFV